jgi:hypothetical protein
VIDFKVIDKNPKGGRGAFGPSRDKFLEQQKLKKEK